MNEKLQYAEAADLPRLIGVFRLAGQYASETHTGPVGPETIPLAVGRTMATSLMLSAAAIRQRLFFRELRDAFTEGWRSHERLLPASQLTLRYQGIDTTQHEQNIDDTALLPSPVHIEDEPDFQY